MESGVFSEEWEVFRVLASTPIHLAALIRAFAREGEDFVRLGTVRGFLVLHFDDNCWEVFSRFTYLL